MKRAAIVAVAALGAFFVIRKLKGGAEKKKPAPTTNRYQRGLMPTMADAVFPPLEGKQVPRSHVGK